MITVIVFGIAIVAALEVTLTLVLFGMAATELGSFLRHHPHGVGGGLRQLAASAREICLAAKNATYGAVTDAADRWAAR
ncbi:hypothetical protein ACBJ59_04645 [Nonomuraea sp. MTCD27]|uniref:hypothetical protein n=1 Tax=Nonomuraea sp. MTCD27 TaxID=1676747 RepID=UPI0035C1D5C6